MSRNFSHPLARSAKVWSATMEDGVERRILVIVTMTELDPKHDRYSKELVRKLPRAAKNIWRIHPSRRDSCPSADRRIGRKLETHCWRSRRTGSHARKS
jgi:hypothetical protein